MNTRNVVCTKIKPFYYTVYAYIYKPIKFRCGFMLTGFVNTSVTKHKGWEMLESMRGNVAKPVGIFDKISRPSRRRKVLNNLFVESITDVLSTSGVAPEVMGYGIEISGVKISKDFTILQVYWQIPISQHSMVDEIARILSTRAPQIRAEMISRNVLGKVPHIYFIQDTTNARLAAFEEALANADMGPPELAKTIPEEEFLKDIFKFKLPREKEEPIKSDETQAKVIHDFPEVIPGKPPNMRNDMFGLDYEKLMSRVTQSRKTRVGSQTIPETTTETNLDSSDNIPGVPLYDDEDNGVKRSDVLLQFLIERRVRLEKIKKHSKDGVVDIAEINEVEEDPTTDFNFEADFFDEEEELQDDKKS